MAAATYYPDRISDLDLLCLSPPGLDALVAAMGAVEEEAGPYYLFPPEVAVPGQVPMATSAEGGSGLRQANPGNWEPDEWDDLLDGRLGPWAMIVLDERVVSICHTPAVLTPAAAECGVWTDPAFRGRGYAAATAAAWAALLEPSGRHLFYSTRATNYSSQRVATRLGLRLLGWTWSISPAGCPKTPEGSRAS